MSNSDTRFLSLSLQYYILARTAVFYGFQPVCGNLYHLAFELLLKSSLSKLHSEKELEKIYSHKLVKLWNDFKNQVSKPDLDKFDDTIASLHKWESVRYLEFPQSKRAISFSIDFSKKLPIKKHILKLNKQEHFTFDFYEMDELYNTIVKSASFNPEFIKSYVMKLEADDVYKRDNKYPLW